MLCDEAVFDLIGNMVMKEQPFSLLRFGDGEGLFGFYSDSLDTRYCNASIKHWGEVPGRISRHQIAMNIRQAYRKCDIAALPFDFDGIFWKRALIHFTNMDCSKPMCSLNIHISLNQTGFLRIVTEGRPVFYISCRDVDDVFRSYGALSVTRMDISEQYRFASDKPLLPFYRQVESIVEALDKIDFRGVLCFLGAGVAGKHLGNLMRDRGGMVIDIGSVFDLWTGIKSRGWIKDATAHRSA